MAERKKLFGRIRIVFRRSSPLTKILILVPLVICIAVALFLHFRINDIKAQTEDVRHQAAQLEYEIQQLQRSNEELDTVAGAQSAAKSALEMVDPDTVFFVPTDSTNPE